HQCVRPSYNGRMNNKAIFSSASDLWGTPPELFRLLNESYDFKLDAAASDHNALCENYFTVDDDSLKQDWQPYRRIWLNPPYGRMIGDFMRKAYEESQRGCVVVCLVPARVDTRWWHDWVQNKGVAEFIKGRLYYVDHRHGPSKKTGTSPFPSALVTYVPSPQNRTQYCVSSAVVGPVSSGSK
ncbi:MAG: phage N-6-adenine-methyltransferase, partial [Pseudomonadota bacterium]